MFFTSKLQLQRQLRKRRQKQVSQRQGQGQGRGQGQGQAQGRAFLPVGAGLPAASVSSRLLFPWIKNEEVLLIQGAM